MTLRELLLCVESWGMTCKDDMRRRAWEVANILSAWSPRPVTPAELLGEEVAYVSPSDFANEEEFKAYMRAQMEGM